MTRTLLITLLASGWLATACAAYGLGTRAFPAYAHCETVEAFSDPTAPTSYLARINVLQADGYRIVREYDGRLPSGWQYPLYTLCK